MRLSVPTVQLTKTWDQNGIKIQKDYFKNQRGQQNELNSRKNLMLNHR